MVTMILSLLKNKYVIFGLIVVAIIAYYEVQGMSYRSDIVSHQEKYSKLNEKHLDIKNERNQLKIDLKNSVDTSNKNIEQCLLYKDSMKDAFKLYDEQIKDKDKQIQQLIVTVQRLRSLPKPEILNDQDNKIIVKDCVIYKGVPDESIKELSDIGN